MFYSEESKSLNTSLEITTIYVLNFLAQFIVHLTDLFIVGGVNLFEPLRSA